MIFANISFALENVNRVAYVGKELGRPHMYFDTCSTQQVNRLQRFSKYRDYRYTNRKLRIDMTP